MVCNSIVNCSALIGVFIGLAIGDINLDYSNRIKLFIAGNFIYIGAVNMMPILTNEKNKKMAIN